MSSELSGSQTHVPVGEPLVKKRKGVKAGIYILPNMITAASMFFGFLGIKLAIEGSVIGVGSWQFEWAAYAIITAAVCDGLDGSVARWTHTQSAFGVQFDSLADLTSFGLAPAWIAYNYALKDAGKPGFAAIFVFALCAALRLARFNVQSSAGKGNGNFSGIPAPMAAITIPIFILAQAEMNTWTSGFGRQVAQVLTDPVVRNYTLLGVLVGLSFGMISTFEYFSSKSLRLPKKYPFRVLSFGFIVLVFALMSNFTITMVVFCFVYMIHGPIMWLFFHRDRGAEEEELFTPGGEEDEEGRA